MSRRSRSKEGGEGGREGGGLPDPNPKGARAKLGPRGEGGQWREGEAIRTPCGERLAVGRERWRARGESVDPPRARTAARVGAPYLCCTLGQDEETGQRRGHPTRRLRSDAPPERLALNEQGLAFEDGQRLFQSRYFGSAAVSTLGVSLWLRDAHVLEFRKVLQHGVQLLLRRRPIGGGLDHRLVEVGGLLRLILDILVLGCLLDLVLHGGRRVLGRGAVLCGGRFREALGEVGKAHLQKSQNACTSIRSLRVVLGSAAVVF